jgi:hypothetical protein
MRELLVANGEVIGYVLVGVLALIGLGIIQLLRRRRDVKKPRLAARLASHSISELRQGPIAVTGTFRESKTERWLECRGQRVALDPALDVVSGTSARWERSVRTYKVSDGDIVIAIGVMSRRPGESGGAAGWQLAPSPEETGVQLFATDPSPAPPPLWPYRAPLILAACGALAYFGLAGAGTLLLDVPRDGACTETSLIRLEIASALPERRAEALRKLEGCSAQNAPR